MADVVNSIPLIPYDRPDWVVQKEKYNRYKVLNFKAQHHRSGGRPRDGKTIFVYDKGNALSVARMDYRAYLQKDNKATFARRDTPTIYSLKVKDGRLVVWVVDKGGEFKKIRNFSNKLMNMERQIMSFGMKSIYAKGAFDKDGNPVPKPKVHHEDEILGPLIYTSSDTDGWPEPIKTKVRDFKVASQRLNRILIHFLRRHKIKFKYTKNFFDNLRIACYPHSAGFELKQNRLNSLYSRYFFKGDIKYVIKKCFGHDSSKLVSLVCERIKQDQSFDCLLIGCLLKGLVPIDYLQQAMKADISRLILANAPPSPLKMKDCRALLKNYNAARIMKLIQSPDFASYEFPDAVNMYSQIEERPIPHFVDKPKNWKEIHDCLIPFQRRIQMKKNGQEFELPVRKYLKEIDGAEVDDLKLEIPKHTDDLRGYSDKLNHCVWSYGPQIKNGNCDILAVYRGTDLLYNISLSQKTVGQFRGKHNCEPDPVDRKKVVDFLLKKQVLLEEYPISQIPITIPRAEPVAAGAVDNDVIF